MLQELADRVTSPKLKKNNRCKGRKWNIAEEPELVKEVLRQKQLSDSVYGARAPPFFGTTKNFLPQNFVFPNQCHEGSFLRLLVVGSITGMSWFSSGTPSKTGIPLRGAVPLPMGKLTFRSIVMCGRACVQRPK